MKLLSIIVLCSFSNLFYAQHAYIPFAQPDKYWFYDVSDGSENVFKNTATYVLWTKGDTLLSGQNYIKIHKSFLKGRHNCPILPCFSPDVPYVFTDTALIGYLRDDIANQVVYFLPEPSTVETCGTNEQVLYNFNLNVGDTMSNCFISLLDKDSPISGFGGIDSIVNIDLFGKERKVLHLELPINKGLIFLSTSGLIEGIGTGVYDPIHYNYEHSFRNFCEGSLFQCQITSSTKNIYKSELQLNPNPSTGMISLDGNKNIINAKFTDVVGQSSNINVLNTEINISDLKPGIYFVTLTDSNNHQYFSKIVKL